MEPFPEEGNIKKLKHRIDQVCKDRASYKWGEDTDDHLDRIPDLGKAEDDLYQQCTDQESDDRIDRNREIFGIFLKSVFIHVIHIGIIHHWPKVTRCEKREQFCCTNICWDWCLKHVFYEFEAKLS